MEYNLAIVKPLKGTPGVKICGMKFHGLSLNHAIDNCFQIVGQGFDIVEESSYHQSISVWSKSDTDHIEDETVFTTSIGG